MWRRAVFERIQHVPEARSGVLIADAEQPEDALLLLAAVDADAAAGDLPAVAGDVVGVAAHLARVVVEQRQVFVLHRCEEVMRRLPALALVVPLDEREVDDERELERVAVDQSELGAERAAQRIERGLHACGRAGLQRLHAAGSGDDQQHVAGRRAGALAERFCQIEADVLQHGRAHLLIGQRFERAGIGDRDEALRAERLRRLCERIDLLAAELGGAGHADALDGAAALGRAAEHGELGAGDEVREVDQLQPEAQIRLVAAEAPH